MNRRRYEPPPPQQQQYSDPALESLLERSIIDAGGQLPPESARPTAPRAAGPAEVVEPEPPAVSLVEFSPGPLDALFTAMSAAQGEMGHVARNAENPFFDSRYADLSACLDAGRPLLAKHGLTVIQFPGTRGNRAVVTSVLGHVSGQWMKGHLELPAKNPKRKGNFNGRGEQFNDDGAPTVQGFGSGFSHARRYAYASIVGLAQIDDDGNQASGHDDGHVFAETVPPPRQTMREGRAAFDRRMARNVATAEGIDTGGHEPGTAAAAEYVGQQKIDALQQRRAARPVSSQSAPPKPTFDELMEARDEERRCAAVRPATPPPPVPGRPARRPAPRPAARAAVALPQLGSKSGEIRRAFEAVREALGEVRYNEELTAAGVPNPMALRSLADARSLYRQLCAAANQEVA